MSLGLASYTEPGQFELVVERVAQQDVGVDGQHALRRLLQVNRLCRRLCRRLCQSLMSIAYVDAYVNAYVDRLAA